MAHHDATKLTMIPNGKYEHKQIKLIKKQYHFEKKKITATFVSLTYIETNKR